MFIAQICILRRRVHVEMVFHIVYVIFITQIKCKARIYFSFVLHMNFRGFFFFLLFADLSLYKRIYHIFHRILIK